MKIEKIIDIIDDFTKYGLQSNLDIENKEIELEELLVEIYLMYFQLGREDGDDIDYPSYDKIETPNIRENLCSNFPDFATSNSSIYSGDYIDDLIKIITELLEVKWKNINNSEEDAKWYFVYCFRLNIQRPLLSLLNFIHARK